MVKRHCKTEKSLKIIVLSEIRQTSPQKNTAYLPFHLYKILNMPTNL